MAKTPIPAYRRQKQSNGCDRVFVVLHGMRHYLGRCDAPESREAYHRGRERIVYFGPHAQQVLRPFMASRPVAARP